MTRILDTGELRIAYDVAGDGPPLLLMHGAEATRQMFAALVPLLAPRFTVITYDQRDCGETTGPGREATLADLGHDAHKLLRGLGLRRAHVFGSSFGGRVAQALAVLHPQGVDRLVLASTWPLPRTYEELCPDAKRLLELRRGLPGTAQELARWFFPEDFLRERPELRTFFAAVRPQSERSVRRTATVATTLDNGIADIAAPTLLLAAELDRILIAAITLGMAARIRGADALLMHGVGHVTAMQAPQLLASHITRFLSPERIAP